MNNLPKRKQIRIKDFDYSTAGAYFVTVCTKDRNKILWQSVGADNIRPKSISLSPVGEIVEQGILQISEHYKSITVDKYCIMPDHIHLIIRINCNESGRIISAPTLSTVVGSLKRWVSKQAKNSIWQKSFFDHAIRNEQDYVETMNYIKNNPLKYKTPTE